MAREPEKKNDRPRRRLAVRAGAALLVIAGAVGAAFGAARSVLPRPGLVASGVRVGGQPVNEAEPKVAAEAVARHILERKISLAYGEAMIGEVSIGELGATIDTEALARRLASVGREGDVFAQIVESLEARRGHVDVPVSVFVPVEELAARLERFKDENDTPPRGARFDFAAGKPTAHVDGRYLDVYAAAGALERAALTGEARVVISAFSIAPRASSEVVAGLDTTQVVSTYATRYGYLGGQVGRAQNVSRAAAGVDGLVLMPGDTVSFNAEVGPRSIDNGFAHAPEIFKGEMREGVGGGTCQVASTLHAAAYLGGLDVVERSNHSRPSGYIPMGLDATVVYPYVDLKLGNPYPFPIVIHAVADKGTLTVELRGGGQADKVEWATATLGVTPFKRKIEERPELPEGRFVVKQKGIRGYSIKKTRTIHGSDGKTKEEVRTDVYPPTFEIYLVPPGTDPGALPALPDADPGSTSPPASTQPTSNG
jgi:vancomycin resistance protein YoaR